MVANHLRNAVPIFHSIQMQSCNSQLKLTCCWLLQRLRTHGFKFWGLPNRVPCGFKRHLRNNAICLM